MDKHSMPAEHDHRRNNRALTDYFLHADFFADTDVLLRARVLVSALCAFASITAVVVPLVLVAPLTPLVRFFGVTTCALTAFAFVYLLFMLKLHGRYTLCAIVAIAIPLVAITGSICITGGIFFSPTSQLLVLQPLVAFFFAGVRGGLIATVIIGVLIFLQIALQRAGVEFPQIARPEHLDILWAAIFLIGFFVLAVMALVYEFASTALRRERDTEHAKVVRLANTDSLTGLANRRAFDDVLNARIKACKQHSSGAQQFALCYLDLDGFKPINDQHGHEVGDQVLRAVSIRLRSALRGADFVGRQGGDEFMLLLNELGANHALELMAQRFIVMVNQPIETSAGLVSVGASLGFAVYPQHADSIDMLKKAADVAMYAAKRNRAGWRLYAPHMTEGSTMSKPPK